MILEKTELMKQENISVLVARYKKAVTDITTAYEILRHVEEDMQSAFLGDTYHFRTMPDRNHPDENNLKTVLDGMKRDTWRVLVNRLGVRSVLSVAKSEALDQQLEKGELPEISEENILAWYENLVATTEDMLADAVKEVFEFLRPHHSRYKTNTEFEIGKRVILSWTVETYDGIKYRIAYRKQPYLVALDNVFSMLDGQGVSKKSYRSPLIDAIETANEGKGQTQYFKFVAYKNNNLHIEFLRPDLVKKLNAVAGGNRLGNQAA